MPCEGTGEWTVLGVGCEACSLPRVRVERLLCMCGRHEAIAAIVPSVFWSSLLLLSHSPATAAATLASGGRKRQTRGAYGPMMACDGL